MNKSAVCRIANRISRDVSRHDAFIQAWVIVKAGGLEMAVRGVSFGNRQEALRRLAAYNPADVRAVLVPEPANPADPRPWRSWWVCRVVRGCTVWAISPGRKPG
jgi:hypothetical protein